VYAGLILRYSYNLSAGKPCQAAIPASERVSGATRHGSQRAPAAIELSVLPNIYTLYNTRRTEKKPLEQKIHCHMVVDIKVCVLRIQHLTCKHTC